LAFDTTVRGNTQHLTDDFTHGQVPFQPHKSGQAEFAIDGTPDLSGDTNGRALPFGHPDSLDSFPIRQPEQIPASAIGRVENPFDFGESDRQTLPQRLGEVRNGTKIGGVVPIHRLIDLQRAKLGLVSTEGRLKVGKFHPYNSLRHLSRIAPKPRPTPEEHCRNIA